MDNELLLLSKNDIPFISAQINIHNPTLKEIAIIGEENFFAACQFINFNKNLIIDEDNFGLEDKSNFDIIMSIMCSQEKVKYKNSLLMLFSLLFPTSKIKFTEQEILILNDNGSTRINNLNYEDFKNIINEMFVLNDSDGAASGYNPIDKRAARIAEKLQRAKNKKSGQAEQQKVAVFSRYISILAVGEQKNINDFLDYTVFQLKDEFKRYQLKQSFDMYIQAKMAGAKDLEEVDNWMDDIHL